MQVDNSVKNKYDSILKIATHAFTNALIPIVELPDDEYEVISCEIFSPGKDVKSMDILLKGKNGYVNIEFHKQPLSKSQLDRDFEYVVDCYMFYGETVEQRIVVVDNNQKSVEKIDITPKFSYYGNYFYNNQKSVEKIDITPKFSYYGNYFYVPDIGGCEVLNNIKGFVNKSFDCFNYFFNLTFSLIIYSKICFNRCTLGDSNSFIFCIIFSSFAIKNYQIKKNIH